MNETVRVMIVQGHCLLRNAMLDRLKQESWIEVCATAVDTDDLRVKIERHKPQVLVINISLKCCAGISSIKKLKKDYFWLSIIALSCDSENENSYIGLALRAGADGFVSSDDSLTDLILAIRSVGLGRPYLSESARKQYQEHLAQESALMYLSPKETEVFFLTGCGYVPQRVAAKMGLSVKTIETYRERIRKKMNLPSGADLQEVATSFMRSVSRRGVEGKEQEIVKELLSATG